MKLHIVIDNIRSAYNVGSIFRTADGTGCAQLYICGISPDGQHPKVSKTALGSTKSVPSKYFKTTQEAIDLLKKEGVPIYAVELDERAQDYSEVEYPQEVALVFGHEIDGVSDQLLDRCEKVVSVPMRGKKGSLNVATVAGIVMYEAVKSIN